MTVSVSARVQSGPEVSNSVNWLTYVDPRFDLSISYPEGWSVLPRVELPNSFGERLVLTAPATDKDQAVAPIKIEIGPYLKEKSLREDIADWSEEYDAENDVFDHSVVWTLSSGKFRSSRNGEIYFKEAISPITPYTYINVPYENMVWGFWINSIFDEHQAILEKIAASLSFGPDAPRSPKQAYQNLPHLEARSDLEVGQTISLFESGDFSPAQLIDYSVPVLVGAYIKCGSLNAPVCGGTHNFQSTKHAIDIAVSEGTNVYAVSYSILASTQYSNTGYGNLLRMRDLNNSYYSFYAHLNSFLIYSSIPTYPGTLVALSGSSGGVHPHLHFHVATNSSGGNAVNLAGMTGLQLYSQHPDCGKATCAEIQQLPNQECNCGRVN